MTISGVLHSLAHLIVRPASAHCDTEDGPVVTAGRRALGTGDLNHALPWVPLADEQEVSDAFSAARVAPAAGRDAAERRFLETLVRLHRRSEGAEYTGIKPSGTPLPPAVAAADQALERGDLAPLRGIVDDDHWAELVVRFAAAMAHRDHEVDNVEAGRAHVAAYVSYVHYALHVAAADAREAASTTSA